MAEQGTTPSVPGGQATESPEAADVPFENEALIGAVPVPRGVRRGPVHGGPVLGHVQDFAKALCDATGACTISTYEGHHPDITRALDILVSSAYGAMPDDFSLGDRVADFTLNHWSNHGVMYIIWQQHINSNDDRGWRQMEDRGSITQNHFDHCHVSFLEGDGGGVRPTIVSGDRGSFVAELQARLNELGWNLDVDGDFGAMTEAAVIEFQGQHGLDQDGVVGPMTWQALGFA